MGEKFTLPANMGRLHAVWMHDSGGQFPLSLFINTIAYIFDMEEPESKEIRTYIVTKEGWKFRVVEKRDALNAQIDSRFGTFSES